MFIIYFIFAQAISLREGNSFSDIDLLMWQNPPELQRKDFYFLNCKVIKLNM